MKNKGYTIVELLVGFSVLIMILTAINQFASPLFRTFSRNIAFYQKIVQINNIQSNIARDLEDAVIASSNGTTLSLGEGENKIDYFTEDGFLIRKKKTKTKLNSQDMNIKFNAKINGKVVILNYSFTINQNKIIEIEDAVYAGNKQ
ncbi:MAG: hypothetical protein DKM50_03965 [Candidatus Margulisiibacteriota bacterium]|nr:MAG: hypothetical protein A2X43_01680 [Candidatus Margulisbacteria bacterium GWD2_39_127]OGI05504.1 MAG: hypothetical protein A2X42_00155 [Candidatus Margulisbacteria bacterium GWF2_38_17]OGI08298.1 MAG: hypothetical protein A2X41_00090 [Candidatus Margulisbacteria bacterium GWE2_39_32]PZM82292.1 MAG: hypothetical protein DKM50_03965 [Candidatus Margulisiibacteriota bacterium]HAR62962.1 hypothetical protein [Candidatus Margulisiibacteriota bacterium]